MKHAVDTAPETTIVDTPRVWCDGSGDIRGGENYLPASLGHPRVYMQIDEEGFVDCGYCDRRFILAGGPADTGDVPDASDTGAAA
ncbi:zinc-finger domain-containing protein [Aurantiacibacter sp. MUD11]|uniref:zinc-finger domain-containing protein n=1 Tax=Aurantiacibacter sp. MUD11 TaxID=3003265 RepID=UPI0022A9FA54|nr:zinc-finger domain-containing protein [Aurantiacibacter sp. MUD11]WAT16922.1 zinc-finger domain-containing protein [Aurantiacibacter sp. MUD11]